MMLRYQVRENKTDVIKTNPRAFSSSQVKQLITKWFALSSFCHWYHRCLAGEVTCTTQAAVFLPDRKKALHGCLSGELESVSAHTPLLRAKCPSGPPSCTWAPVSLKSKK